jgi:hypothetical protein
MGMVVPALHDSSGITEDTECKCTKTSMFKRKEKSASLGQNLQTGSLQARTAHRHSLFGTTFWVVFFF